MKLSPLLQVSSYEQLKYTIVKNTIKKSIQKGKDKFKTSETTIPFFLRTDFGAEDKNYKAPAPFFMAIGEFNGDWKKYIKEQCKKNKKFALLGRCYFEEKEGVNILHLIPAKGKAKPTIISKMAKKILKPMGIEEVVFDQGSPKAEEDGGQSDNGNLKAARGEKPEKTKDILKKALEAYKKEVPNLAAVVAKIKAKTVVQEDKNQLNPISSAVELFISTYKEAPKLLRVRFKDVAVSFVENKKKIAKINAAIDKTIADRAAIEAARIAQQEAKAAEEKAAAELAAQKAAKSELLAEFDDISKLMADVQGLIDSIG